MVNRIRNIEQMKSVWTNDLRDEWTTNVDGGRFLVPEIECVVGVARRVKTGTVEGDVETAVVPALGEEWATVESAGSEFCCWQGHCEGSDEEERCEE